MNASRFSGAIDEAIRHWSLTLGKRYVSGSRNYVTMATLPDEMPVVLKVGVPDPDIRREGEALRLFDGRGAVKLLDADFDAGCLLLEHAEPGRVLNETLDDQEAVSIAIGVMKELWRPAPANTILPRVDRWLEFLRTVDQPAFPHLIEKARILISDLIKSSPTVVLFHGDLNPGNIVSARRQPWLAIDPKGEIGDPAWEVGPWFYNVSPHLLSEFSLKSIFDRRLDQFAAELGFDRKRLQAWAFVDAVLSACWSTQDRDETWTWQVSCAQELAAHL